VAQLAERGLKQVLCEGGPTLFGTILAADRADELCLTVSPVLEAGEAGRIAVGPIPAARDLSLAQVLASDGTLMLRYLRT
jgi:riboflavin biosynthesis pyrimidine reductase